ncbi:MAG: alpha/beta fold hydrolase [Candidimonas sp.]|nr:MAG: alpha/beta fold hydrolase [Candidimonas sp.]
MSYTEKFIVPRMGEPFDSARVVAWNKKPGEDFKRGDVLLEIETDKSVVEIPATGDGRLLAHLVEVDGVFGSDTPVAAIELEGEAPTPDDVPDSQAADAGARAVAAPAQGTHPLAGLAPDRSDAPALASPAREGAAHRVFATPAARGLADEYRLDLARLAGSGPNGRVTKRDVLRAAHGQPLVESIQQVAADLGAGGRTERLVSTGHGDVNVVRWAADVPRPATTVVLLHGIFGDASTWSGLASNLRRTGSDVLAIDLPCHGKTGSSVTELSVVVDCLTEVIEKSCAAPIVLVGHSFGGALVARIAASAPRLAIRALVLVAPVGLGTEIQQAFLDGVLHASTSEALARELRKLTASGASLSAAYLEELRLALRERARPLGELCAEISCCGVQQIDITPDLQRVICPVTLIQGRADEIIPWAHALNAPAHVAIHLPRQAGHMPQWDTAKLVEDVIAREAGGL